MALLHKFEKSQANRVEWEIYEAIGEMIRRAENVEIPDVDTSLEADVRNSDEMAGVLEQCSTIRSHGGDN